jgi:small subunit ribosomal protein S16
MSVRIRLRRVGRKKQPSYRLVVADSATPRDGAYLDTVGFYNPRTTPAELRVDLEKVDYWLDRGASTSVTVASLLRKARRGGDAKVALLQPEQPAAEAAPRAARVQPAAGETTPVGDEPGGVEPEHPGTPRGEAGEATGAGAENAQG